ncbi:MAG: phosphatidylglycerol lysyltransferase domain-containing protein [Christensenellaceae bacterium]|nr:phosphatidylglycerol lysyltransferase domain-containing protein [Christensenellaceae bacterium]
MQGPTLDFQPVQLGMRPLVQGYTRPLGIRNSEYTFTSLLMWGTGDRIRIAEREDALYILYTFPNHAPFMLAPLCKRVEDTPRAIAVAAEYLRGIGAKPRFHGITQDNIRFFEEAGYACTPDRDNFDYVYNMEDLRTLAGKKYHGKRNHIHQFLARYEYEYIRIEEDTVPECLAVYEQWLETKDTGERGVLGEWDAIRMGLANLRALELFGGGIRIAGELRAFTLAERIDAEMAVVHFEKADADVPGLYPLINREFVEHALREVRYINREEDMGLAGLRRAKLSYNPAFMVEKYVARPQL